MPSQNISTQTISKILSDSVSRRSFSVPHIVYDLPLTSGDFRTLLALFKLQSDFVFKSGDYWGWFFVEMKVWKKHSKCSRGTFKQSRRRLKRFGLVDYCLGNSFQKRATEVRIHIDPFYLADLALSEDDEGAKSDPTQKHKHLT